MISLPVYFLSQYVSMPHHCDEYPPSTRQDSGDVTFGRQRRSLGGGGDKKLSFNLLHESSENEPDNLERSHCLWRRVREDVDLDP